MVDRCSRLQCVLHNSRKLLDSFEDFEVIVDGLDRISRDSVECDSFGTKKKKEGFCLEVRQIKTLKFAPKSTSITNKTLKNTYFGFNITVAFPLFSSFSCHVKLPVLLGVFSGDCVESGVFGDEGSGVDGAELGESMMSDMILQVASSNKI